MEKPAVEPTCKPQPAISAQSTYKVPEQLDLADTFNLFQTYLDSKIESFKEEFSSSDLKNDNITKSIKKKCQESFKTKEIKYSITLILIY